MIHEPNSIETRQDGEGRSEDALETATQGPLGSTGEGQGEAVAEEWRAVVGYEGKYEVSNLGGIRSLREIHRHVNRLRQPPLLLIPVTHRVGYRRICLSIGKDQRKHYSVHALVAAAFIGPRPEGKEVAHRNGVRVDCRASNLLYATRKENHSHKKLHGTQTYGGIRAKLNDSQVLAIRKRIASGTPLCHLAREYGVTHPTITKISNRDTWRHL